MLACLSVFFCLCVCVPASVCHSKGGMGFTAHYRLLQDAATGAANASSVFIVFQCLQKFVISQCLYTSLYLLCLSLPYKYVFCLRAFQTKLEFQVSWGTFYVRFQVSRNKIGSVECALDPTAYFQSAKLMIRRSLTNQVEFSLSKLCMLCLLWPLLSKH